MNRLFVASFAAVGVLVLSIPVQAQNLIANGSFESPVVATDTATMTIPSLWSGNQAFIVNGDYSPGWSLALDGVQYIGLGNPSAFISQVVTVNTGGSYVLKWFDGAEFNGPCCPSPYSVTVKDSANNIVGSASHDANPLALRVWTQRTIQMNLTPGNYTVRFQGQVAMFGPPSHIDNVLLSAEVTNEPPDCTNAAASITTIWPPNNKFVTVNVVGVTDPDDDTVTITIDSIYQDEPVGTGNSAPDGKGVGTSAAQVRAERDGNGNGRVYHIFYTADDGNGGECNGEVTVCVPHDQGQGANCVDGGALYDSTGGP